MISLAVRVIRTVVSGVWRACRSDSLLYAAVLASTFPALVSMLLFTSHPGTGADFANQLRWYMYSVYAVALLVSVIRRRWLLLLFGLAGGHTYIGWMMLAQFGVQAPSNEIVIAAIAWGGRASFAFFILRGRVRSPEYFGTLILLFTMTPTPIAMLFTGLTLGLRFVFLVFWQNLTIILDIGLRRAAFLSVKALVFWSPILLFMIPSVVITNRVHDATMQSIYENGILTDTSRAQGGAARTTPDVRLDIHARIEREFQIAETSFHRKMEGVRDQIDNNVDAIPGEVLRVYMESVPPAAQIPGLAPSEADCAWYDVPCWILHEIIESIKSGIRSSYDRTRLRQGLRLYMETKTKAAEVGSSADRVIDDTKARATEFLDETEAACKSSVDAVFRTIEVLKLLSNIALVMIMIRSYLYVFARVTFTKRSRASVSLRRRGGEPRHGSVRKWGNQFGIEASSREDYYVSRRFEPNGRAPNFAIPQMFAGIARRIRYGSYTMNRIRFGGDRGPVYFTAVRGAEFISWHLEEGETVVFDYKNFVAMSEGIRLSSEVSFRVSSAVFGRIVFPTATGPGTLVLLSTGSPTIGTEKRSSASVPPARILAWHAHTRFTVESELNIVDMYLSAVYLERVGNAPVIIDADTMNSPAAGLARFIRYFILPM